MGESILLLLGISRGDKHPQTTEKMFCLTRGNVIVRSGTAHPEVLKICLKQSMREGINRVKLPFLPEKRWKARGDALQTFRGYEPEILTGIFLKEERVNFSDQQVFFL